MVKVQGKCRISWGIWVRKVCGGHRKLEGSLEFAVGGCGDVLGLGVGRQRAAGRLLG